MDLLFDRSKSKIEAIEIFSNTQPIHCKVLKQQFKSINLLLKTVYKNVEIYEQNPIRKSNSYKNTIL